MARQGASVFTILLVLLVAHSVAHATAAVNVDQIETDGEQVTDLEKIYVREDTTISITFSYEADSKTTVDGWEIWYNAADTGTLLDSGDFSGSSATLTLTTDDVGQQVNGLGGSVFPWRKDVVYDYSLVIKIKYTEDTTPTTTDGDYDTIVDTTDGDTDETVVNDQPTQKITIHVDEDSPLPPTLDPTAIPGEGNLLVSWEPVTMSESGETEPDGLRVMFCVRAVDSVPEAAQTVTHSLVYEAAGDFDADIEDVAADGDIDSDVEIDADTDSADSDNNAADGDTDGEVEQDDDTITPDGDTDVADGDVIIEDGDEETDDEAIEVLEGCMEPMPESGSGDSSYRITGLTNNTIYEIRGRSRDLAGNVSTNWSDPIYGSPQEVDDFWESYQKAGGKEDGGFCFIATAAYGTYSADQVQLLRRFRDGVLAKSEIGRKAIKLYYRSSPPIARWVAGNTLAAAAVRVALAPVILVLTAVYGTTLWSQLAAMGLLLLFGAAVLVIVKRLRRKEVL